METEIPKVIFRMAEKRAEEIWLQIKKIEGIHSSYCDSASSIQELKELKKQHTEIETFLKFYQTDERD